MKKLNVYKMTMENDDTVFNAYIPAHSKKEAIAYVEGNGDIIVIKDTMEEYTVSSDKVRIALKNYGFGKAEIDIITRTLHGTGISD